MIGASHDIHGANACGGQALGGKWIVRFQALLVPVIMVLVTLAVYISSIGSPFVFDDEVIIAGNPGLINGFAFDLSPRSLVNISFKINYDLAGLRASSFRITNILIHICTMLALYGLVRRTLLLRVFTGRFVDSAGWLSGAIALIWAVHPLQTESVTYICQRYESAMGLFMFLILYSFVRSQGSCRPGLWTIASYVAFCLGLGTKEVIITIPVLVLLFDYCFMGQEAGVWRKSRWLTHAVFWLIAAFGVFAMPFSTSATAYAGATSADVSRWTYLLTQAGVILHYIRLSFYPSPLCLDYQWEPVSGFAEAALPVLAVAGMLTLALALLLRRRSIGFLGAAFFAVLAPTSSIIPVADIAFEHRMYVPLAALIVAVVMGVHVLVSERMKWRIYVGRKAWPEIAMWILAVAVFGTMTVRRNETYGSEERVWAEVIEHRPGNLRALNQVSVIKAENGQLDEAIEGFTKIVDMTGQTPEESLDSQRKDVRARAFNNLGTAYSMKGDLDASRRYFERALRTNPKYNEARNNLASVLWREGRSEEATNLWGIVLLAERSNAKANASLSMAARAKGDMLAAARHLETAADATPDSSGYMLDLAWLLATSRDEKVRNPAEASRLLALYVRRGGADTSPGFLTVKAAASAAGGEFDEAIRLAELAISENRRYNNVDPAELQRQIESYRGQNALYQ